jgi:membrane protein
MAKPAPLLSFGNLVRFGLAYAFIASFLRGDHPVAESDPNKTAAPARPAQRSGSKLDFLRRLWTRIGDDRVVAVAAGLTFYTILAIFPAVTAVVSIYGLFADPMRIGAELQNLSTLLPGGAISVIDDQVKRIASQGESKLGFAFVVGLGVALWSANAGMKALFDALNVAYETKETRGFLRLNAISLLFTISGVALVLVLGASTVVLPWILAYLAGSSGLQSAIVWLRWPLYIVVVLAALAVVYRYGPARENVPWKWVTPGSLFACFFWFAASVIFAFYAANFGSYNKTYGALGAIIGFMTWIWVSAVVVMVGAEINAMTERRLR